MADRTSRRSCAPSSSGQRQVHAARMMEPVIDHMLQSLDKPVRLSTLSAIVGISDSHFFSVFKSVTGCAPIKFFIRLRMERACHLLRTGALSVREVAANLGYDDPFYFSRLFKSVTGLAPSDYRQKRIHSNLVSPFNDGSPDLRKRSTRIQTTSRQKALLNINP